MAKQRQRYSPGQIVRKIQDADRILDEDGDLAAALRELNATEPTYKWWRNKFGGLKAENAKKLLAEAELEKAVLTTLAEENLLARRVDVGP